MKNLGTTHLILLFFTVVFIGLTMYLCSKLPKKWQNLMFIFGALMCAGAKAEKMIVDTAQSKTVDTFPFILTYLKYKGLPWWLSW